MKRTLARESASLKPMRLTPASLFSMSSLVRFSISLVISVPAGPPLGGLYLKPPSCGGLCEGVMTTPSAAGTPGCRFQLSIAWEMTGVGV